MYIQNENCVGESALLRKNRRSTKESAVEKSMPKRRFFMVAAFCEAIADC